MREFALVSRLLQQEPQTVKPKAVAAQAALKHDESEDLIAREASAFLEQLIK